MFSNSALAAAVALLALSASVAAAPQPRSTPGPSLTTQLRLADTAAQRYQLLKDEDFVFDFSKSEVPMATRQSFPALVGSGAGFTVTNFDPCSMSFVHLHPRASELFAVTAGSVVTEMVPEAGVVNDDGSQRVIRTELGSGMMTVFPAGSFHTQVNPGCENATIAAAFTSEDPGAALVAEKTFSLGDDIISRTFGESIAGEDIDKVRDAIPQGIAIKVDECLKKCGIEKR